MDVLRYLLGGSRPRNRWCTEEEPRGSGAVQRWPLNCKIVVVGNPQVGKSAMLEQFTNGIFLENHVQTIGLEYRVKNLQVDDSKMVRMQFWDTGGERRFRGVARHFYKGACGVMILFDLSAQNPLESVVGLLREVEEYSPPNVTRVLVGTKRDLVETTDHDRIADVANRYSMEYFEVSAIDSNSVVTMMQRLAQKLVQNSLRQSDRSSPIAQHIQCEATSRPSPTNSSQAQTRLDQVLKFLLIGDSEAGKTALVGTFADDTFPTNHLPTIGVDFRIKTVDLDDKVTKMQIWDTSGQTRFPAITNSYHRGSNGILLVCDVTRKNSFTNMQRWVDDIQRYSSPDVPVVVVGNKCDNESRREVSSVTASEMAHDYGWPYMETSAKEGMNVEQLFITLAVLSLDAKKEHLEYAKMPQPLSKKTRNQLSDRVSEIINTFREKFRPEQDK